jgi:type VII secretion-associated protein (TIGR03931 family)
VLVVGVAGAVVLATGNGAEPTGQRIARYGYSFELIPGWEQAGGDARLREVRLTPSPRPGPEEVLVQENQLGYDSGAEPERPRRELLAQLAAAQPGHYTDFDPDASFAGRTVAYYRESPGDGSTVDWYLLFEGKVQVNIGCRHTPAVAGQVERACREVVRTLRIR